MSQAVMRALRLLAVVGVVALVPLVSGCDLGVEKPEKDGPGALSITIERTRDAPDYHTPLDWWTANHPHGISDGVFSQRECMLCHMPNDSCNSCHDYVGVKEVRQDGR
jgi:hypothetical protein